jgi:hypothetical protein
MIFHWREWGWGVFYTDHSEKWFTVGPISILVDL